jgi:hypothetical protein
MNNPENLTQEEIKQKIKYLEWSVNRARMYGGRAHVKNRIARIALLRSYLKPQE